jgi:hypothetical protein
MAESDPTVHASGLAPLGGLAKREQASRDQRCADRLPFVRHDAAPVHLNLDLLPAPHALVNSPTGHASRPSSAAISAAAITGD